MGGESGADIEWAKRSRQRTGQGKQIGTRDVGNIDIVAHVLAVAINGRGKTGQHFFTEDGDHAGFTMRVLARAVDVAVPQGNATQVVLIDEEFEVLFADPFADAVRGDGGSGVVFGGGCGDIAVEDAAGGGEDDATSADGCGAFEDMQEAHDVVLGIEDRLSDGAADRHLSSLVGDGFGLELLKDLGDGFSIADIDLKEGDAERDVGPAAGGEVIEDGRLVAVGQE